MVAAFRGTEPMTTSGPLAPPRTTPRQPGDFVLGCGQPPEGVTSGRVCAGVSTEPACQLCPNSPTYWRNTDKEIAP